jgi:hypothetical protein
MASTKEARAYRASEISSAGLCPRRAVVSVTSVNRLKTRTSDFDQYVKAPAPNTIMRPDLGKDPDPG